MKGWTVITQPIKNNSKGMKFRSKYLFDYEHENHTNTEEILLISGDTNHLKKAIESAELRSEQLRHAKKGGRPPSSFAMEYALTLPKGYRPSKEQWFEIIDDCLSEIAEKANVERSEIDKVSMSVLHQQLQNNNDKGAGDHCHLIIGKFLESGECLKILQQKTMTHIIKSAFSASVLNVCGIDWKDYALNLNAQAYPNKRRVSGRTLKVARKYTENS